MENESDGVEPGEQISESFICCVCLELLYKPVVLACGHVSCFWCVHRTMDGLYESRCPICRNPYGHFPAICQMLHFLLLKMYPVAYKTRETHILEEEKKMDGFLPKVDDVLCGSHTNEELNHRDRRAQSFALCDGEDVSSNLSSNRKEEACAKVEQQEFIACIQDNCTTMPKQITAESFKSTCAVGVKESHSPQRNCNKISGQVSVVDVLCASCNQLLFRPSVLNCGHVYCEACIAQAGETIRCQICQSPHPGGLPKVCLEFDHFLEEQFPEEYTSRRGTLQPKKVQFQHGSSPTCLTKEDGVFHWLSEHGPDVHIGVGCDSCGMCPIKGDRYRCIDCKEAVGFDLCGDCYNTPSKLPGRFNQQHTPDHKFEKETTKSLRNIMLRMLRGDSVNGLLPPSLSGDGLEDPENLLPLVAPSTASDLEEPENDDPLVAPSTASRLEEPENDDTQPLHENLE